MVEPEGNDPLPIEQDDNGGTEGTIIELKQQKARAKTVFTRARRQLLLYMKLQKKLPAAMLAAYHQWIFENRKKESVEVREWAIPKS